VRRRSRRLFILLIDTHAFMRTGMYILGEKSSITFRILLRGQGGGGKQKKLIPRRKTLFGSSFLMVLCIPKKTLPLPVCSTEKGGGGGGCLKVHKHDFFFSFFAETETIWSQGPVTRDFGNRIRFGRDIRLSNISAHAQHAVKSVPRMLSMRRNSFGVCSATDEIRSAYSEHILNDNSEMWLGFPLMLSIRGNWLLVG
jgi:hypothetical protein